MIPLLIVTGILLGILFLAGFIFAWKEGECQEGVLVCAIGLALLAACAHGLYEGRHKPLVEPPAAEVKP